MIYQKHTFDDNHQTIMTNDSAIRLSIRGVYMEVRNISYNICLSNSRLLVKTEGVFTNTLR